MPSLYTIIWIAIGTNQRLGSYNFFHLFLCVEHDIHMYLFIMVGFVCRHLNLYSVWDVYLSSFIHSFFSSCHALFMLEYFPESISCSQFLLRYYQSCNRMGLLFLLITGFHDYFRWKLLTISFTVHFWWYDTYNNCNSISTFRINSISTCRINSWAYFFFFL